MRHLMLLVAFATGFSAFTQEPLYNWGEPSSNEYRDHQIEKLLTLGDDGFVLLRKYSTSTYNHTYFIEFYNSELKMTDEQKVEFNGGVMGDMYDIEDIRVVNGVIYAFVTHWHKDNEENTLYIKEITLNGNMNDIAKLAVISAKKMMNRGDYSVEFSADGSKLLVLAQLPFEKKTFEKVKFYCFNTSDMSEIWSHEQELTYESERAANNEIRVDNAGQAYMFKKYWDRPVWRYSLYACDGQGTWKTYSDLAIGEKQVVDYKMVFDNNNEFAMFALLADELSAYDQKITATWTCTVHSNLDLGGKTTQPINTEMIALYQGDKAAENGKRAFLDDFLIKDVLFRTDGHMLVLLEQQRTDKKPIAGTSPIRYNYEWNYGDFMALCLNYVDNELIWWQSFAKNQKLMNTFGKEDYGSYIYFLKEDRLYVLWNNTELSIPSIPPAHWVESDGSKYVKHKVFDEKTVHATFLRVVEPDGSLAYGDKKFGLPLLNLHKGAIFEMSMVSSFFFEFNGDLVVMASMHNGGKRYRFGFIGL